MKVITYQSANGNKVNLTVKQIQRLESVGVWPKDSRGGEYCIVSHGLHYGEPSFHDDDIEDLIDSKKRNGTICQCNHCGLEKKVAFSTCPRCQRDATTFRTVKLEANEELAETPNGVRIVRIVNN